MCPFFGTTFRISSTQYTVRIDIRIHKREASTRTLTSRCERRFHPQTRGGGLLGPVATHIDTCDIFMAQGARSLRRRPGVQLINVQVPARHEGRCARIAQAWLTTACVERSSYTTATPLPERADTYSRPTLPPSLSISGRSRSAPFGQHHLHARNLREHVLEVRLRLGIARFEIPGFRV